MPTMCRTRSSFKCKPPGCRNTQEELVGSANEGMAGLASFLGCLHHVSVLLSQGNGYLWKILEVNPWILFRYTVFLPIFSQSFLRANAQIFRKTSRKWRIRLTSTSWWQIWVVAPLMFVSSANGWSWMRFTFNSLLGMNAWAETTWTTP